MKRLILLALFCGMVLGGCASETPTVSVAIFNPAKTTTCILAPSQSIALSITGLFMPTKAKIEWQVNADQGRIDGPSDQPTVTYVAPDQPRQVIIRVQVSVDGRVIGTGAEACTVEIPKTDTPVEIGMVSTSTVVDQPTLTSAPLPTATAEPIPCACQKPTYDEIFTCLIMAESQAANEQDLVLIERIFDPAAAILRGNDGQTWASPLEYYAGEFTKGKVSGAMHEAIQQVDVQGEAYFYVSGSKGSFTPTEAPQTPIEYKNPSPSEHWVFERNERSCWVITRFDFNASHVEFP